MSSTRLSLALVLVLVSAACNRGVDVDDVPVGTAVQLTRDDGGVIQGTLASRDDKAVSVDTGSTTRSVPRDRIADVQPVEPGKPAALPEIAKFREHTVPVGTALDLELDSAVNTASSRVGEPVRGVLAGAISVDGVEVVPAGAAGTRGRAALKPAGTVKGRASVTIQFTRLDAGGESYPINARFGVVAPATKGEDAKKIGIPAVGGAVVGGILGGKQGAAIGAAIGGGAGTAAVLLTPGEEIVLGRGAKLSVILAQPVEVRTPIK
jgi:hypothetical protein